MNLESSSKISGKDRVEIGRQSYEEGHSFEKRVAELYRLLRYEVDVHWGRAAVTTWTLVLVGNN
jgi:hypothetical protein